MNSSKASLATKRHVATHAVFASFAGIEVRLLTDEELALNGEQIFLELDRVEWDHQSDQRRTLVTTTELGEAQLARSYAEFAEADRKLAEEGIEDYERGLVSEDAE
jgi:hypothetical protein